MTKLSPIDVHIGEKLKIVRIMSGVTQAQLGELIGVTFQQIQKYERGLNRISASRLYELSQIFGKPVSAFFSGYKPDKQYYNFEHKQEQDYADFDYVKNREITRLLQAFSKISKSETRKYIISLLNSLSD